MTWNTKYKQEDLRLIPSKAILSDFGKAIDVEDIVELHIFSSDGLTKLFSEPDITSYKVAEGGILDDGTINNDSVVFLDLHNDIRNYVSAGTFVVKYNFFRTVVGSNDPGLNDLFVDEISTSRKEIIQWPNQLTVRAIKEYLLTKSLLVLILFKLRPWRKFKTLTIPDLRRTYPLLNSNLLNSYLLVKTIAEVGVETF